MEVTCGIYADGSKYVSVHRHYSERGIRELLATVTFRADGTVQYSQGMELEEARNAIVDSVAFLNNTNWSAI